MIGNKAFQVFKRPFCHFLVFNKDFVAAMTTCIFIRSGIICGMYFDAETCAISTLVEQKSIFEFLKASSSIFNWHIKCQYVVISCQVLTGQQNIIQKARRRQPNYRNIFLISNRKIIRKNRNSIYYNSCWMSEFPSWKWQFLIKW